MVTLVFQAVSDHCCLQNVKKVKIGRHNKHNNVLYVDFYVVFNDISFFPIN